MTVLLEARKLSAGYGGVAVLRDLDLEIHAGEMVALLASNGAGKTTTMLTLCGEIPPLSGEVHWRGSPTRMPFHRRAREGLSFVSEQRWVFMNMTTADNLRLGSGGIDNALDLFPELRPHLKRKAGLLSGGQQQLLALARALATEPRVLLADELSLGLAPLIVERLLQALREATDRGVGVLIVEQHVRQALAVADRAYVLHRGSVAISGTSAEILSRMSEVERLYLAPPVTT
jgi:branched-chain amino acid transport system ATP-binding protein